MSSALHPDLLRITERIRVRSAHSRRQYLDMIASMRLQGKRERSQLSCTNLAHAAAAMPQAIKIELQQAYAPIWPSCRLTTTFYPRTNPCKIIPPSSNKPPSVWAQRLNLQAVHLRCAMASPKAKRAWNCLCFRAMSSP